MEEHDPDSAWLCLRRDTVDKLNRYKAHSGVPGWDAALTRLLDAAAGIRPHRERAAMSDEHGRPPGRGDAVRGLHPVPVPAVVSEEPGALDVRRCASACLE